MKKFKRLKNRTKWRIRKTSYEALLWEYFPSGKKKFVVKRNFSTMEKLRKGLLNEFGYDERDLEVIVNKRCVYFNGMTLTFYENQILDNF